MSHGYTLCPRHTLPQGIDLRSLRPDLLASLSRDALERLPIDPVACVRDLFQITTHDDAQRLVIEGDLRHAHRLGFEMQHGHLDLRGDVGHECGARMRGGTLTVHGKAGNFVAAEMRGGLIHVHGSIGSDAAGPLRGGTTGMSGGELQVDGSAGDYLGNRLRRGTIHVRGSTGQATAFQMIAGTIIVEGRVGTDVAHGMRRGTLLLLQRPATVEPLRFTASEHLELSFLRLVLKTNPRLRQSLEPITATPTIVHRQIGDRTRGGTGELIFWE